MLGENNETQGRLRVLSITEWPVKNQLIYYISEADMKTTNSNADHHLLDAQV